MCKCQGHPAICTQQSFNDFLLNVVFLIIFTEMLRFYKSGTNVLALFIFWAYKLFCNSFLRELFDPQNKKTYLLTCTTNEVSNQPAHPRSLIRLFVVGVKKFCTLGYSNAPVKILIRLRECAGWSESSLGAYIRRKFFVHCGSFEFACDFDCPVLN